ncbi:hypothetical protein CDIK_2832 [Cucumispora dikerogammari]|nr:hypothetical protein CDIK_2832 [Cucumispora dikerogammari]
MIILNMIPQTTRVSHVFIATTLQSNAGNFKQRGEIQQISFLASNSLNNFEESIFLEKISFKDFRLNIGFVGNYLLLPLVELKSRYGKDILTDFSKLIDCNKVTVIGNDITERKCGFYATLDLKKDGACIYSELLYATNFFIYENLFTKKLNLYLMWALKNSTINVVQDNEPISAISQANRLTLQVSKQKTSPPITFKATQKDKTEEYILDFPEDFPTIVFSLENINKKFLKLSDDNINDKYGIIRSHGNESEETILNYNLVEEKSRRILDEETFKLREQLSSDFEKEKDIINLAVKELKRLYEDVKKANAQNKRLVKVEEELKSAKEELKSIKKAIKSTIRYLGQNQTKLSKS